MRRIEERQVDDVNVQIFKEYKMYFVRTEYRNSRLQSIYFNPEMHKVDDVVQSMVWYHKKMFDEDVPIDGGWY